MHESSPTVDTVKIDTNIAEKSLELLTTLTVLNISINLFSFDK